MERSLDPERIARALGETRTLPNADELGSLLAEAEVGLFMRQPQTSDELISTGWFLHGIASAEEANAKYGIARRRAAWEVSAHIFDLALETVDLSSQMALQYCFAAQVGYLRSYVPPNAAAIYRRVATSMPPLDVGNVDVASLLIGVEFLRLDWGRFRTLLTKVVSQLRERSPDGSLYALQATSLGPIASVALGCQELATYFATGRAEALAAADQALAQAVMPSSAGKRFIDARWVAAQLRTFSLEIARSSVWGVLPPSVPNAVKRAFTLGRPAVSLLWEPQIQAVAAQGGASPLDPGTKRVVLSVPTSTGKTLISHLFALSHLETGRGDVCFVVPTRSLAREVRRDLSLRLRMLGRDIAAERDDLMLGAWGDESVEVMTPERLAHSIRHDAAAVLDRFGLFVFDEVHSIGEGTRGFLGESTISLLNGLTRQSHHRIIVMSAALGNRTSVRAWLDPTREGHFAASDWRGPRRLNAVFSTHVDWKQPTREEFVRSRTRPVRIYYPVFGQIEMRLGATGGRHLLRTADRIGELAMRYPSDEKSSGTKDSHKSTPFYRMLGEVIRIAGTAGPVLIVRSTRKGARDLALDLAASLETEESARRIGDTVRAILGDEHPLGNCLDRAVAYHHSGLPTDVLNVIETGVRDGSLKYVVATTGITDGVNLPVRSVVIYESTYQGANRLTPAQVINAVGRAGRASVENEGWAILVREGPVREQDFLRLNPVDDALGITSRLATASALEALTAFESTKADSVDAVFAVEDGVASDFISFVWMLLATLDELDRRSPQEMVNVIQSTLAWTQFDEDLRNRWLDVAEDVAQAFEATAPHLRRRWAKSTTSLGSARVLSEIADETASIAMDLKINLDDPHAALDLLQAVNFLDRIEMLPEVGQFRGFFRDQTRRQEVHVNLPQLLNDWIQGVELETLSNHYLGEVSDPAWRQEQMWDYVTTKLQNSVAWLAGVVIEWANDILEIIGSGDIVICRQFGSFVRHGTSSPQVLALLGGGLRSRSLAHKVADIAQSRGWETLSELREGIQELVSTDRVKSLNPSTTESADILEFTRDREAKLLSRLMNGEGVAIPIDVVAAPLDDNLHLQAADDQTLAGRIAVFSGGREVAAVPAKFQWELNSLVALGWHSSLTVDSAQDGTNILRIALNLDDY